MNARVASMGLIVGLGVFGCGGEAPPPASPSAQSAYVIVSGSPQTVRSGANTGADAASYPVSVSFDLVVVETAGVQCSLINQTLVASPDPGPVKIIRDLGTAVVPAGGVLRVPMTLLYTRPIASTGMSLGLGVSVIDVRGNTMSATGYITVR